MSSQNAIQTVVVGVDETPAGQKGVRYAALEAHRLGAALSILHVTPGYTSAVGIPAAPDDVLQAYGEDLLAQARKDALATVPDLEVGTRLVVGNTSVHALADRSHEAALVVLGGERRSFAGRVWTGDIVAGVAAMAACPVAVVPPEWEPDAPHGRVVVGVKDSERAAGLVSAGLALADGLGDELVVLHAWKAPSGYDDILARRAFAEDYGHRHAALLESLVQANRGGHTGVVVRIEVPHAQPAQALVSASAEADRLLIGRPRRGGAFHHLGPVGRALLHEARCPVEVHEAG